jgi:hypothetical protein
VIFITAALMLALVLAMMPMEAHALTKKNQKAHAAYEKAMQNGKIAISVPDDEDGTLAYTIPYAYIDINKDGYDELVQIDLYSPPGITHTVWTYYKGKIKKALSFSRASMVIYPKTKTILFRTSGHMGVMLDAYYKLSKGKGKCVARDERYWDSDRNPYEGKPSSIISYKNGKVVSRAAYLKYTKSLKKGKPKTEKKLTWGGFYIARQGVFEGYTFSDYTSAKKNKTYYIALRANEADKHCITVVPIDDTIKVQTTLCDAKKKTLKSFGKNYSIFYKLKKNTTYYLKVKTTNKKGSWGNYSASFYISPQGYQQ